MRFRLEVIKRHLHGPVLKNAFGPFALRSVRVGLSLFLVQSAPDAQDMMSFSQASTGVGSHVLLDLWGCESSSLQDAMTEAAVAAGATVLETHFHDFAPAEKTQPGGMTGVVLLAESHITVHTWPEKSFIAIDIFMCGTCDPDIAADVLVRRLKPTRHQRTRVERGRLT